MAQERSDVVRRAMLAVNREDEEAFLAELHPDVEWHSNILGLVPAEVWRGREAVRTGRRRATADGRHVRTTLHELRERGDNVLVLGVVTSDMPHRGQSQVPISWIWTVRDGRALRIESFRSRAAAEAAFAARPEESE